MQHLYWMSAVLYVVDFDVGDVGISDQTSIVRHQLEVTNDTNNLLNLRGLVPVSE
jgi:hypothetical protein